MSDVALLPAPLGIGGQAVYERYLKQQAEVVLKGMIEALRSGTLDYAQACCGLGRITGYYDLLAELDRQRRRQEESRP